MSRVCPQCSQIATESTTFCIRCGYRFPGNEQGVSEEATLLQVNLPNIPATTDPGATLAPGGQPARAVQPPASQTPVAGAPSYAHPGAPGSFSNPPGSVGPDPNQVPAGFFVPNTPLQGAYPQGVYPPSGYAPSPYGMPLRAAPASGGVVMLQRAFAGKGVPVHHQSWLLDGNQVQPAALRTSLLENIHKQGVPGVSAVPERLREYSVAMEERDFIRVQYGTASVFVYLAPMGSNLYVSRTSTVQQPFSRARITTLGGLLVLLLLCWLLSVIISPYAIQVFFEYAFLGLLFFFLYILLRSVVSWFTDNDFLVFLRPNQLNDFTLDTLSSVEHVTDKAIRETLKQAGLSAEEVTRPAQSYAPQQPLRRF